MALLRHCLQQVRSARGAPVGEWAEASGPMRSHGQPGALLPTQPVRQAHPRLSRTPLDGINDRSKKEA